MTIPDSIEFPDEARWIIFVLLGELPLQASSDMAYASAVPYDDYADGILDLRERITELVNKVDGALPSAVAARYKEAMGTLTGADGSDVLAQLVGQIHQVSENRVGQSRKIMESKYEIIAEAMLLLAELAIIAALSFFTGGLSFGQTALAKARTRLTMLLILQRLLNETHLLPALSQGLQEALTTFAVRLAMLGNNDGDRRPKGIDGGDIFQSFLTGLFAGLFSSVLTRNIGDIFKNRIHNFDDSKWRRFGADAFTAVVSQGPSEAFAEFLVNGLLHQRWKFDLMALAGGSISAVIELILSLGAEKFANDLHNKFSGGQQDLGPRNQLPGPNTLLGGGQPGGRSVTPPPTGGTTTTVSSPLPSPTTSTSYDVPPATVTGNPLTAPVTSPPPAPPPPPGARAPPPPPKTRGPP
ncbi:sugar-binding protein, partial [Streptomyces sp. NPDC055078]